MIKVTNIDHVAIAVPALDALTASLSSLFGLRATPAESIPGQGAEVRFLHPRGGETALELVAPAGSPALGRFLDRRGQALHHVCLRVEDLPAALAALRAAGVSLVDEQPRPGARGHQVAFLHPKSTGGVLFELCQQTGAGTAP